MSSKLQKGPEGGKNEQANKKQFLLGFLGQRTQSNRSSRENLRSKNENINTQNIRPNDEPKQGRSQSFGKVSSLVGMATSAIRQFKPMRSKENSSLGPPQQKQRGCGSMNAR